MNFFYVTMIIINNNKKYVLWNVGICFIASEVGHVILATPPLGSLIVPYVLFAMHRLSNKEKKTKSLASSVEKLWRAGSQNLKK